ncbi:MAG: hypothetical protein ABWZ19_05910, partial [Hyphomicrobium sp.]
MSAAVEQSGLKAEGAPSPHPNLRDLLLLRIAVGGATRADLQRDVAPLLAARISGLEFRRSTELALSTMAGAQLTTESKGRLTVTDKGRSVAEAYFTASRLFPASWTDAKISLTLGT